jgi:hypothetical protein
MQKVAPAFDQGRFAFWIQAATSSALFRSLKHTENCSGHHARPAVGCSDWLGSVRRFTLMLFILLFFVGGCFVGLVFRRLDLCRNNLPGLGVYLHFGDVPRLRHRDVE